MLKEFKKFALKGNMVDLAIGIIIGGAFNSLVSSLVNDIIMPIFSVFTKNINFTNWYFALNGPHYDTLQQAKDKNIITINYGVFISGILNFLIMAFVVFLVVRWINKFRPTETPSTKKCPHCMMDVNINASKCPYCTSDINTAK